jgi:hypothetical protein
MLVRMLRIGGVAMLAAGARTALVTLTPDRTVGSYNDGHNDGHADDLALTVS